MTVPSPEPVEQLLAVAQALMSATDPDQVLATVTRVGLELFEAEACSLSLYDRSLEQLVFFISQGEAKVEPFRIPAGQGIAGHVFQSGETYLSNDVPSDRHFFAGVERKTGHSTRSMLCCPMGATRRTDRHDAGAQHATRGRFRTSGCKAARRARRLGSRGPRARAYRARDSIEPRHERGAFTGAVARKRGKFELADSGTLFLDEIGELAIDLQAKLLRVLQDGDMQRVGGTESLRPNVRIVAATNRDLATEVEQGRFRLDLFYRLRVIAVTLPPLRERREDIPGLAQHFLVRTAREQKRRSLRFRPEALERLCAHDWRGNVRELANVIERAVVLCPGDETGLDDLPSEVLEASLLSPPDMGAATLLDALPAAPLAETLAAVKRQVITSTLNHYEGNQVRAAAHLGLHPSNLSRALKQLGMR